MSATQDSPPQAMPAAGPSEQPLSRRKRWAFRLGAILLGLALLVGFEGLCVWMGWGRPSAYDDPFVGFSAVHPLFERDAEGAAYHIAPSRRKFFAEESFPAVKGPRTRRIFCLGGSTVQGRPYSIPTSFTTWLEIALNLADERYDWEVVNCGGVSYASYRLIPILQECLAYEPDLFIVCTGHNEFLEDRSYAHIRDGSPLLQAAGGLRTFVLLRAAIQRVSGGDDEPDERPVLSDDADAILDYEGGLTEYHWDDAWREGVTAHFEFNLRRMARLADDAGVPLLFVRPTSNLADSPPFKSEHGPDVPEADRERFRELYREAQAHFRDDLERSVRLLRDALEIDPRYGMAWFELGKCLQAEGRHAEARDAYLQARENDVCPLRMIAPLEEALRRVADETEVPLVDAHQLLEAACDHGILDGWLLRDHVHPSFKGHQMIADALVEEMGRQGWCQPADGWRGRAESAYRVHLDSLDRMYFYNGEETLKAVQGWTRGLADRQRPGGRNAERPPEELAPPP